MDVNEFDAVQKYIEDTGTVYPVVEGRVTLIQDKKPLNKPGSASQHTVSMSILFVTMVTLFNYFQ